MTRMKMKWVAIARLALVSISIAIVAGCGPRGDAARDVAMQAVGNLQVGATTSPNPPTTGENTMTIVVRDATGKPVRNAQVETIVSMPAMGAMPYMESRGAVRQLAAGTFRVQYGLAMAGDWDVQVKVLPSGAPPVMSGWRLSTNAKGVSFVEGAAAGAGVASTAVTPTDSGATNEAPRAVVLDAQRRQSLGIRLEPAVERDLTVEVRAAGRVAYDETRWVDVTARLVGFVRAIHADFTGQAVRRGDALFEIYSPEAWAAQQEFLQALVAAREDSLRGSGGGAELAAAARKRLMLWGLGSADVEGIARTGKPRETLPVRAPVSGVVTEKNVVLGSPIAAGQIVYRIAPTDPVWVLANVYEQDLPWVKLGAGVTLTQTASQGPERHGRVSFIAPDLAADTRTGTVRIAVSNADGLLKPGMYIDAVMHASLGKRLAIPESAVLPTGERSIVFVDLGEGRLVPREVTLGARAGDWYEVRAGLSTGERVVTSGNFLVAAESRLRSASGKW